jgi:hypothetical protein
VRKGNISNGKVPTSSLSFLISKHHVMLLLSLAAFSEEETGLGK